MKFQPRRLPQYLFIFSLLWLFMVLPGKAQEKPVTEDLRKDLFADETPLQLTLSFDRKLFIKAKYKGEYQEGILTMKAPDGTVVEDTIRLRARGEFRRNNCFFPPIKLNFKKSAFRDVFQQKLKSLKLVTHCNTGATYKQYVNKEYMVYKLHNLFTPYSFRVRRVEITYLDNQGKRKPIEAAGFLIEDMENLAERLNCREVEQKGIKQIQLVDSLACELAVFQYMIGNYDWKVEALHNVKVLGSFDPFNDFYIAVPYDFDITGMVNPAYGAPPPDLPMKSIRDRIFLGRCFGEEQMDKTLAKYMGLKPQIYDLYQNTELLDARTKKDLLGYLDDFFTLIENKNWVKREFLRDCN